VLRADDNAELDLDALKKALKKNGLDKE